MRSLRLPGLAVAACLLALAAGALASRGSAAAKRPAPTPRPNTSSNTVTTVSRTFVSTTGSDSNACTAAAPCRGFATAMSKTTAGGEVVALTSGGYGPVTIGMAVTIVGAPGVHAAITATSGDAIDVEAGSSDTVVLRNLYLNGVSGTPYDGINLITAKRLELENITASGFGFAGVFDEDDTAQLFATDVATYNNHVGFDLNPTSGFTGHVNLDRVRVEGNSEYGIYVGPGSTAQVSNCISSGNGTYGLEIDAPTMVSGCRVSNNGTAGIVVGDVVSGITAQIASSTITHNGIGLKSTSGSTLDSFGDNLVAANTTNTSGTITTIGKS